VRRKNLQTAIVRISFGLACLAMARADARLDTILSAMAVRQMAPGEAAKEYPVRIRAVVTYVNAQTGELFVQDASAGIFVFLRDSKSTVPLEAGQTVEIDGVTAPGDFTASITKAEIGVQGRGPMPKPLRLAFERLLTGQEDSQWGELKGVIRSGRLADNALYLNVATAGGAFLAIMKDYPADWATRLIDAKVTFEGVLAAVFNEHRQVAGVRIFIPAPHFIRVDDPAPAWPFDLPRSPAVSVGAFRTGGDWARRIHVRATVTAAASTALLYVADGEGNLPAELDSPCGALPGDLLDIAGFAGQVEGRPGLKNSICRVAARGRDRIPLAIGARDLLPLNAPKGPSGAVIAAGIRHDLKLVTLDGTLVQVARGVRSETLTMASRDRNFTVTIPESVQGLEGALELGTKLKITGVCLIASDEYRRAQSFRILVRRTGDIVVESRPPWWNLGHALWIMGAMLLSVFLALGWIAVLRKHVATRTNELRAANERLRQVAVEDALTGAANRRKFDEMLEAEMGSARRTLTPLSLILADIDYFKAVNDLYGHQTGDRCLIEVVRALRHSISRHSGVVARYGGEEFAVILPGKGDEAAAAVAEAMRRAVEEAAIPHLASPFNQRLSVSVGVGTLWPHSVYSTDRLIGITDRALYRAKQSGRNRVVTGGADGEDRNMAGMLDRLGEGLLAGECGSPRTSP
jgi:diguanylate cyclase (GGDEF)-like protein